MPVRVPEIRDPRQKLKFIFLGAKMSFDVADAHCNVHIHNCLDSGPFGRHVLCATGVGIKVHDTLAKRTSTSRTKRAAPRRDKVVLSLGAFDFPLVLQWNSLRIGPF